jgi:opacity protein-like surface antigen
MHDWKKAALAAGAIFAVSSGPVLAEGWVAGVRGGAITDIDFDGSSYLVGVFAGYDFADDRSFAAGNWRLQGEFAFSSEDNGVSAEYYSLTAAAYREFDTGGTVRPYLVAGLGGAHINVDFPFGGGASTTFLTVPLGAGLSLDITDNWSVDLDYRVHILQVNTDATEVAETSEISGYIRYNFGTR